MKKILYSSLLAVALMSSYSMQPTGSGGRGTTPKSVFENWNKGSNRKNKQEVIPKKKQEAIDEFIIEKIIVQEKLDRLQSEIFDGILVEYNKTVSAKLKIVNQELDNLMKRLQQLKK